MFTLQIDDQISLRMLTARDAEPLFHIIDDSRDHLKQWLPWLDETKSADDSLEFIKGTFYTYNNQKGITAGIFYKEQLVGVISYNALKRQANIGEIGYWLAKNKQGKGIMTKAVAALIKYGFDELQLNKIEIKVAEHNVPSRAIPERLGFKQEGHLRDAEWLYDHYVDHIVYGLLKSEFYTSN